MLYILMAALMQQPFTFSSSTDHWGHLILAPKELRHIQKNNEILVTVLIYDFHNHCQYLTLYNQMTGQTIKTTRKGCARKWTFSKLVPCPGTGLKGLMKPMVHLSQYSRSLKQISNLGPHKYDSPCQKLGQETEGSLGVPQSLLAEEGGISFWATMLFKHLLFNIIANKGMNLSVLRF